MGGFQVFVQIIGTALIMWGLAQIAWELENRRR
jgi:hypothetical protein